MQILVNNTTVVALEGQFMDIGQWYLVNETRYQKTLGYEVVVVADEVISNITKWEYINGQLQLKPVKYKVKYSHLNFFLRFTEADQDRYIEKIGIPANDEGINNGEYTVEIKKQLKRAKYMFGLSSYVDLENPLVLTYLTTLKTLGILVDADVAAIVTPNEILE